MERVFFFLPPAAAAASMESLCSLSLSLASALGRPCTRRRCHARWRSRTFPQVKQRTGMIIARVKAKENNKEKRSWRSKKVKTARFFGNFFLSLSLPPPAHSLFPSPTAAPIEIDRV